MISVYGYLSVSYVLPISISLFQSLFHLDNVVPDALNEQLHLEGSGHIFQSVIQFLASVLIYL